MSAAPKPTGTPVLVEQKGGLVVVDKPGTWLVHNSAYAGPVEDTLTAWVRRELAEGAVPLHRIDRATSGLVAFAASRDAAAILGPVFASGANRKTYVALCRGELNSPIRVDHALRNDRGNVKDASSDFWPLDFHAGTRTSLIAASPITGRTHQLRRHAKHLSHPLVGDVKYGKGALNRSFRETHGLHRLALHHAALRVGDDTFFAPLSGAFSDVVKALFERVVDAPMLERAGSAHVAGGQETGILPP